MCSINVKSSSNLSFKNIQQFMLLTEGENVKGVHNNLTLVHLDVCLSSRVVNSFCTCTCYESEYIKHVFNIFIQFSLPNQPVLNFFSKNFCICFKYRFIPVSQRSSLKPHICYLVFQLRYVPFCFIKLLFPAVCLLYIISDYTF